MASVAAIIIRPPLSEEADALLEAQKRLASLPAVAAIDQLPAKLREAILAITEGRGERNGLIRRVLAYGRQPGSVAPMGKLEGDDTLIKEKKKFYDWVLEKFHEFLRALYATALHLAIAEVAARHALRQHDALLAKLKTQKESASNPTIITRIKEKIRVIARQKEDLQEFVDHEIPKMKHTLESPVLPAQATLETIDNRIKAMRKANRIFDNAYKAVAKVARTSAQFAGQAASMAFRRSSSARKVIDNTVKTLAMGTAATMAYPPAQNDFTHVAAPQAQARHYSYMQMTKTTEGDDDDDGDSVTGQRLVGATAVSILPEPDAA